MKTLFRSGRGMFDLILIGIGTGNPEHLTGEGRRAIVQADLILIPRKGSKKSDLADLRRQIVDQVRPDGAQVVREFDLPTRDPGLHPTNDDPKPAVIDEIELGATFSYFGEFNFTFGWRVAWNYAGRQHGPIFAARF